MARTLFPVALALAACADPSPPPSSGAATHALAMSPRLWLGGATRPSADPVATAVTHVAGLAKAWSGAAGTAQLAPIATVPVAAGAVVRLAQTLDGVPLDGGEVRVLIGTDGAAVAASGDLVDPGLPRTAAIRLDAAAALAAALDATVGRPVPTVPTPAPGRSARATGAWFSGGATAPGEPTLSRARVQQVWARAGLGLEAAWVVEAFTSADGTATTGEAYRTVVSAVDGRVLSRRNLTADAGFQYRVWADPAGDQRPGDGPIADFTPHPTGTPTGVRPPFVPPALVSVDGRNVNPGGTFDPWLPAGATESNGNNVDAYVDVNAPDGLSAGDFRATVTAPGVFDRTYDLGAEPLSSTAQQMAAVTSLFYTINWLHDDWYDSGFTEAAGNAQADNFGRGGMDGDVLRAEAQDNALGGSRNNANMSTPSDGFSPRMQMFLWSAGSDSSLTLTPGGTPATRGAAFGPGNLT
ncbi:MAG: M36 family metallopeptidase [Kofleriaceae bacterium]